MIYSSGITYGRSNYANRSFGSKPAEIGKQYKVQITETSRKGDGIVSIRGYVIFVKGAQIGQSVKTKVTSEERGSLRQKLLHKKTTSKLMTHNIHYTVIIIIIIHYPTFHCEFRSTLVKTREDSISL